MELSAYEMNPRPAMRRIEQDHAPVIMVSGTYITDEATPAALTVNRLLKRYGLSTEVKSQSRRRI
jgi:hypothetical protein